MFKTSKESQDITIRQIAATLKITKGRAQMLIYQLRVLGLAARVGHLNTAGRSAVVWRIPKWVTIDLRHAHKHPKIKPTKRNTRPKSDSQQ